MLGPGRPPAKQLVNVHELLERVYHLLRSEAPEGVVVERDYDPSLPAITVDPNHIIQAMLNLGRNAIQALSSRRGARAAADPAHPRRRATSASAAGATGWWPPFNSRTTARASRRKFATRSSIRWSRAAPTASGLGLGIAQDLVSRHGGLIEFDSAPGPNDIRDLSAHGQRMNAKPLQVWLVDDDASIRWVLEKALKGSGMAARLLRSGGQRARRRCAPTRPMCS